MVSSNSPKKRRNEFVFTTTTNLFICFLGEFEDTKKSFRNYLTFNYNRSCKFVLQDRNSISICTLIITSNHLERNQGPKYLLFTPSELSSKDQNQWRKTKPIFVIRPERNGKRLNVVGTNIGLKEKGKYQLLKYGRPKYSRVC